MLPLQVNKAEETHILKWRLNHNEKEKVRQAISLRERPQVGSDRRDRKPRLRLQLPCSLAGLSQASDFTSLDLHFLD